MPRLKAPSLIEPEWPAHPRVRALSTTRLGGVSLAPWDAFNLGDHVGDNPDAVAGNREQLAILLGSGVDAIHWLEQVHGIEVFEITTKGPCQARADAATTTESGQACAIMTADCLPVLFCDGEGTRVAAAHAGWRGLVSGVLENTLAHFDRVDTVMAWLGPAIGPTAFEVGPEVRQAFLERDAGAARCFSLLPHSHNRYLADIYALSRRRLQAAGVKQVLGGNHCTVQEPARFFSYRRDGQTGRQASLIWLEN